MTKVNYDSKPSPIEAVGNGSYLYRWDIEQVTTTCSEMDEPFTSWDCYEVTLWGAPSENSITEVAVEAMWGGGVEQKLLNDYQAAQLGLLDQSYASPYSEFLIMRKELKARIAEDIKIWKSAT